MKQEYENVKQLIHDKVSLLCRNSLSQEGVAVRVQGLIGITVGDSDVFLVHFDEAYHNSNDVSGSEHDKREDVFPTSAAVADPSPKSNRRKRQRVSETTPAVASGETGACETDSDVIFNADEVNGNDVKLDFGQIRNFVGSGYDCNQTDNSQWFKSEDTFIAPDPNTSVNSRECQGGSYTRHGSRGNVLLINMLADENNYVSQPNSYMSDQMTYWQSAAASNDPTMVVHQTASVKCEQTSRPRVKQEYWSQPARQIVRRYRQRQQQQQQQALAAASSDVGNGSLVLARSLHECGYPDCGKIFRHKQHLLRHQTQKHGRTPTRMLGLQKVWLRPGDMDQDGGQQNFNTSGGQYY